MESGGANVMSAGQGADHPKHLEAVLACLGTAGEAQGD